MTAHVIELRHLPSVPLAVVRRRVPASALARVVPECCGLVWNALRAQSIKPGRNVAVYWNADIRLEVGVELEGLFREEGELVRSATPAGLTAFTSHFGLYDQLGRAHEAIRAWCTVRGHPLSGPNWEIYGHWQSEWHANSPEIRTDVFYQLAAD
jgi:effector-binding domain-containing protein